MRRLEMLNVNLAKAALLLVLGLLAGCASQKPDVATYYDFGSGLRTDLITDNPLDTGEPGREMLWLNASRVFTSGNKSSYYLEVTYAARAETGYLDIGPGPTLFVVADGKELKFSGNGSRHLRKQKAGLLNESALYPVLGAELREIASAKKVLVRVVGQNGIVQRDFKPENSARFREFVEKFASQAP